MRRTLAAVAVAAAAYGTLLAPAAHAGTNGQQVEVDSHYCWWGELTGQNQSGTASDTGKFYMPAFRNAVANWWWVGEVEISCWDHANVFRGTATINVPKQLSNSDWIAIEVEPVGAGSAPSTLNSFLSLDERK